MHACVSGAYVSYRNGTQYLRARVPVSFMRDARDACRLTGGRRYWFGSWCGGIEVSASANYYFVMVSVSQKGSTPREKHHL